MLDKKHYSNGQKAFELTGDVLTYFFKNGKVKAEGLYVKNLMEGEWRFYRESGKLWQVGNFKSGKKNGCWMRLDRNGKLEYESFFENNKEISKIPH